MGDLLGIAYQAKRDGKTDRYFHEFAPHARGKLVARDDGRRLYIDGGSYIVTDHGIEDMPKLFTVNPSPRRKGKPMARRRRAASTRRRATRQVAIFSANPRRRRRSRARRSYRRNPVQSRYLSNPRRRRRRSVTTARRRSYRRNPSARRLGGGLAKLIMPAVGVGIGALAAEFAMAQMPIPATWKTGVMRQVTKAGVAIGLGYVVGKILKQKRLGMYIGLGGVAIAAHDLAKELLLKQFPSMQFGYYNPGMVSGGFGQYLPNMTGDEMAMAGNEQVAYGI